MQTNIEIHSLTHVDLEEVSALYNLLIKITTFLSTFRLNNFRENSKMEDINLDYSVGASIDGKLVGFLLYGIRNYNDVKTAYIGGTGVCPEHRGKKITQQMLDFSFPKIERTTSEKTYF